MLNESNTESTLVVEEPKTIYMHNNGKNKISAAIPSTITRQPSSMSNIDLAYTIPPRIITKDASYSFIWIDDHYKDLSNSNSNHESNDSKKLKHRLSTRGCCNLFTILFIISIILFLFLYPFITFYFLPSFIKKEGD